MVFCKFLKILRGFFLARRLEKERIEVRSGKARVLKSVEDLFN